MAVKDGIAIKERVIIPTSLQDRTRKQLPINHMGIEKTRMLACNSIYSMKMNANIEEVMTSCPIFLHYQATCPRDKVMPPKILGRFWKSVGSDMLTINNKHYLFILNYHSKLCVVKQGERPSADNLIKTCQIIFSEYWLPIR